jgi:hypothetical protein
MAMLLESRVFAPGHADKKFIMPVFWPGVAG